METSGNSNEQIRTVVKIELPDDIRLPGELKPDEQSQPAHESTNLQYITANKRGRGRPPGSKSRKKGNIKNILKSVNAEQMNSTERIERIKPVESLEPWTTCRLRHSKREIVRSRIADIANDTLKQDRSERRCNFERKRLGKETEEQRYLRLERMRNAERERRGKETEEQRLLRLERMRISEKLRRKNERLERLATKTEEERISRVERERRASRRRYSKKIVFETEEQRYARLERGRIVTENEKERSLRLERGKRARQSRRLEILGVSVIRKQFSQRVKEEEDQKPDLVDTLETSVSFIEAQRHEEEGESPARTGTFTIDNLTPSVVFHETMESPTQMSTITSNSRIKREASLDAVCHLLQSICSTHTHHHQQRQNRFQLSDNSCTFRTSNYILSTVIWHKLNKPIDNRIDESFIESDPLEDGIKDEWSDS